MLGQAIAKENRGACFGKMYRSKNVDFQGNATAAVKKTILVANPNYPLMKKLFSMLIAVAVLSVTMVSCKKGPDDPSFSFRSRTSRVSGDWAINSFTYDTTTVTTPATGGNTKTERYNYSESGTSAALVYTRIVGGNTTGNTTPITVNSHTYSFDSDGNVTHKVNYTVKDTLNSAPPQAIATTTVDVVETGNWNFTGGVGDPADMEFMNISYTSVTEKYSTATVTTFGGSSQTSTSSSIDTRTYGLNQRVSTFHILRCANDELILEMTVKASRSGSSTTGSATGTTTVNEDSKTSTGNVLIKLKQ